MILLSAISPALEVPPPQSILLHLMEKTNNTLINRQNLRLFPPNIKMNFGTTISIRRFICKHILMYVYTSVLICCRINRCDLIEIMTSLWHRLMEILKLYLFQPLATVCFHVFVTCLWYLWILFYYIFSYLHSSQFDHYLFVLFQIFFFCSKSVHFLVIITS